MPSSSKGAQAPRGKTSGSRDNPPRGPVAVKGPQAPAGVIPDTHEAAAAIPAAGEEATAVKRVLDTSPPTPTAGSTLPFDRLKREATVVTDQFGNQIVTSDRVLDPSSRRTAEVLVEPLTAAEAEEALRKANTRS